MRRPYTNTAMPMAIIDGIIYHYTFKCK